MTKPQPACKAIKITPEMFDAGVKALRSQDFEVWESRTVEECRQFVGQIYLAMQLAPKSEDGDV